jgi:hypothetical protein
MSWLAAIRQTEAHELMLSLCFFVSGETRQPMPYQDEMALSEMEPFEGR